MITIIVTALLWFALGWLSGVLSGAAWLLWALRRKSDDLGRLRGEQ